MVVLIERYPLVVLISVCFRVVPWLQGFYKYFNGLAMQPSIADAATVAGDAR